VTDPAAATSSGAAVNEYDEPAAGPLPTSGNVTDHIVANATNWPDRVAFSRRQGGVWLDVDSVTFLAEVRMLARGLVTAGIHLGDRVALMSRTRYEWSLVDYAIWFAGGIVVPVYETSSAEQVQWILSDSGATAVIVETQRHLDTLGEVRSKLPELRHTWVIDSGDLATIATGGESTPDEELDRRRDLIEPDTIATIIYTSGTTGRPKGCILTHGNFLFESASAIAGLNDVFMTPQASTLLFLPLAHVFGRIIQVACVAAGVRIGHTSDVKNLVADLAEFRPTFLLAVPRVFEKIFNGARQRATAEGKGKIFDLATATAIAYSEGMDRGGASMATKVKHVVFDHLVYGKLRAALGGNIKYAISGGAPLGARLGHFFRGIGLDILEGYGLTETTAASSVNRPGRTKIGTVGPPLPGTSVRIADDGEILLSGPNVFHGYWQNEGATTEVVDPEGWFHSGDIGELDTDGFLRITGRKKELLVTAGGKNVAPAVLEDRIRANYLVSQCLVVGDARPYIAALVTIDPDSFPDWLRTHGRSVDTRLAECLEDSELRADIQLVIDDANKAVSHAEAIKRFRILATDWTEETGHLTPSLKLKRAFVLRDHATDLEALYN
jgi:long-chain acyl-CoA synthetase